MEGIKCPQCGIPFNETDAFCSNCGCPRPTEQQQPTSPPTPHPQPQPVNNPEANMDEPLSQTFLPALQQALLGILHLLLVPFNLWKKSVTRLAHYKENQSLVMANIHTPWPFLTFIKRFTCDFFLDLLTFLSYIILPIIHIKDTVQFADNTWISGKDVMEFFLGGLLVIYLAPVALALLRDFIQLLLLPIRKFISWGTKPAQYYDLNVKKKDKESKNSSK